MKKTLLGMAAAALLFAGCSKEELVDETLPSEGVSSVAGSPGQEKNFWSQAPSIWFNKNNGRMLVRLKGNPGYAFLISKRTASIGNGEDPNGGTVEEIIELQRVGNSRFYRSAVGSLDFPDDADFSLVNVELTAGDEEVWNGDVFLYPSGRTVAQDPAVARLRIGPQIQFGDGANGKRIAAVIADDPTGQVAGVRFSAVVEDEDGIQSERVSTDLELVQLNQNLGLARYLGRQLKRETDRLRSKTLEFTGSGSYGVDFLDETANTVILSKYTIADVSDETVGVVVANEVDEPEFLGTALRSKTGESWTYEVAIADLGDWVESASATITYSDPKGFNTSEAQFDLELVRTEGNLKVFRRGPIYDIIFGTAVSSRITLFGTGTRSTSSQASTRAELL